MKLTTIAAAVALSAWTVSASAVVIENDGDDGAGTGLQSVIDGLTVAPNAGTSSVDVNADQLSDGKDSYWNITGSGGSVSTFVMEIAGLAGSNTFGVYDRNNPNNYVELFSGSDTYDDGFDSQKTLSLLNDGSVGVNGNDSNVDFSGKTFGYYLGSSAETEEGETGTPIYFSDSLLNPGESDQMVALQGNDADKIEIDGYFDGTWTDNEFILAWEDILYENSDKDFNDLVVMVESVTPVPEPGTLALLGLGLVGLGAARRQKG